METKQLNGYKIEFYSKEDYMKQYYSFVNREYIYGKDWDDFERKFIYAGLISEISEELTEKIVSCIAGKMCSGAKQYNEYKDYKHDYSKEWKSCKTAKQSFQTLSDLKYCVIIKME